MGGMSLSSQDFRKIVICRGNPPLIVLPSQNIGNNVGVTLVAGLVRLKYPHPSAVQCFNLKLT